MTVAAQGRALIQAAHPGPATAVTLLATAFAVSVGLPAERVALVAAAVLAGQLSIGWSNDLLDQRRDAAVGRLDKPLAAGAVARRTAQLACGVAALTTVLLSLACGLSAGVVHLACVAAGWAYNLGVKATTWSWLPFALAFGGLPVFVVLSEPFAGPPSPWIPVAGALLGVGAHLVNVLPDLADDEATGVRGLAHRMGARRASMLAVMVLVVASVVILIGAPSVPGVLVALALVVVGALAGLALVTEGRTPFRAAIGIATMDVAMLVIAT